MGNGEGMTGEWDEVMSFVHHHSSPFHPFSSLYLHSFHGVSTTERLGRREDVVKRMDPFPLLSFPFTYLLPFISLTRWEEVLKGMLSLHSSHVNTPKVTNRQMGAWDDIRDRGMREKEIIDE